MLKLEVYWMSQKPKRNVMASTGAFFHSVRRLKAGVMAAIPFYLNNRVMVSSKVATLSFFADLSCCLSCVWAGLLELYFQLFRSVICF